MTKQEEIREWAFAFWHPVLRTDELTNAYIKDFFNGLAKRGVVIKVGKELLITGFKKIGEENPNGKWFQVEPLIKEEQCQTKLQ